MMNSIDKRADAYAIKKNDNYADSYIRKSQYSHYYDEYVEVAIEQRNIDVYKAVDVYCDICKTENGGCQVDAREKCMYYREFLNKMND